MRLDDAHNTFKSFNVESFEDKDVIGDEDIIFRDSNWVVVKQDPPAGTKDVNTDTTIKLSVGNEDDDQVLELIPKNSAFAREVANDKAEDKAKAKKDALEKARADAKNKQDEADKEAKEETDQKADAKGYAAKIDRGFAKSVRGVMRLYVKNADAVQSNGGGPVAAATNALAAKDFFDQTVVSLTAFDVAAPNSLDIDDADDEMVEAMSTLGAACNQLLVAIDSGAPSALAQELRLREQAVDEWNNAMRQIYGAANQSPVLIPLH